MRKQWWFLLAAILLISFSVGLYVMNHGVPVQTVRVTKADLIQYVQATGKVKSKDEHKVFSQTNGKLLHVYVKDGDSVKENQILAEMDPSESMNKLQQLEQQLAQVNAEWNKMKESPTPEEVRLQEESVYQAELQLAMKTREWNKSRNDYDAGIVSKEQLQQKEDELKLAKSTMETAQLQLALVQQGPSSSDSAKYDAKVKEIQLQREQLETELSKMKIISPWSGTITELSMREGQMIEKGTTLLTVSDLSQLEIVSEVKESIIPNVFMNQPAIIEGSALGKEQYAAHVMKIAPIAKAPQNSLDKKAIVTVTLSLDKSSDRLLPGYNVDVNFVSGRAQSALQIPGGALKRKSDGTAYVWTARGTKAIQTPIETGIKNDAFIEVKKGLEPDSLIIVNAPDSLRHQQTITFGR